MRSTTEEVKINIKGRAHLWGKLSTLVALSDFSNLITVIASLRVGGLSRFASQVAVEWN